jgi:hypothetical protein
MPAIHALVDIVKKNAKENMVMAEVGAFCGQTTKEYADIIAKNNGKLYIVDWFKGNLNATGYHEYREDSEPVYQTFLNNTKNYKDYITILRGDSNEMISKIPDKSLDICFIDADHTYEFVKRDIDLAIPKLKHGGILCGHDLEDFTKVEFTEEELEKDFLSIFGINKFDGVHPGVIRAVYEKFGTEVTLHEDTVWSKIIE